jgi:hypothetical protein
MFLQMLGQNEHECAGELMGHSGTGGGGAVKYDLLIFSSPIMVPLSPISSHLFL